MKSAQQNPLLHLYFFMVRGIVALLENHTYPFLFRMDKYIMRVLDIDWNNNVQIKRYYKMVLIARDILFDSS